LGRLLMGLGLLWENGHGVLAWRLIWGVYMV
jgi:hypothetical protein